MELKEIYILMNDKLENGLKIEIGRGKECDIQLIDKSISRDHATMYL